VSPTIAGSSIGVPGSFTGQAADAVDMIFLQLDSDDVTAFFLCQSQWKSRVTAANGQRG
jgi:hypothetical protein